MVHSRDSWHERPSIFLISSGLVPLFPFLFPTSTRISRKKRNERICLVGESCREIGSERPLLSSDGLTNQAENWILGTPVALCTRIYVRKVWVWTRVGRLRESQRDFSRRRDTLSPPVNEISDLDDQDKTNSKQKVISNRTENLRVDDIPVNRFNKEVIDVFSFTNVSHLPINCFNAMYKWSISFCYPSLLPAICAYS